MFDSNCRQWSCRPTLNWISVVVPFFLFILFLLTLLNYSRKEFKLAKLWYANSVFPFLLTLLWKLLTFQGCPLNLPYLVHTMWITPWPIYFTSSVNGCHPFEYYLNLYHPHNPKLLLLRFIYNSNVSYSVLETGHYKLLIKYHRSEIHIGLSYNENFSI